MVEENSTSLSSYPSKVRFPVTTQVGYPALFLDGIEHEIEKLVFVRHVPVERHWTDAKLLGDATHVDSSGALGIRQREGTLDDLVPGEGLGPSPMAGPVRLSSTRGNCRRTVARSRRDRSLGGSFCLIHCTLLYTV